ncbi:MAG: hypothetical protein ACI9UA_002439 [Pseudoalteromonas tetraodonis]
MNPLLGALWILAITLLGGASSLAQNPGPTVYTVGNTYVIDGATYAYILWQPGTASTTFGKTFAIYRKDGDATSASPFTKHSVQRVQTAPSAIQAMLKLGGQMDFNAAVVAERINLLYADVTLQPDEIITPAPTEPDLVVAQQLAQVLEIAKNDDKILQRLFFFGRSHPGIMISIGSAFAIKVPAGSVHTYEVRELDGGGNDARVIGRVTLDANNPLALTAPGPPVAVQHPTPAPSAQVVRSAKDHLACRFRWATPDPLRRLVPHTFGYNLYRVKEDFAVNASWHLAAPNIADLEQAVSDSSGQPDPDAAQVNIQSVLPDKILSAAEAGDLTNTETIFTHDDKSPPDDRFESGETFYYFVAARDIAGHPGPASSGTRVVYCDRIPPPAPAIESIDNVFVKGTDLQTENLLGTQFCRICIRQTPNAPAEEAVANYHIYRWEYAQQYLYDGGNPLSHRIGTVSAVSGEPFVYFDDNGPGAPMITPADDSDAGITWWYTVRAEDSMAPECAPFNLSGHSGPAYCVLRDRKGPGTATGTLQRCRAVLVSQTRDVIQERKVLYEKPDSFPGLAIRVKRLDPIIKSADIRIDDPNLGTTSFATTRQFPSGDTMIVLVPFQLTGGNQIMVRGRSATGQLSNWATTSAVPPPQSASLLNVYDFECSATARYSPISQIPPGESPPEHEPIGPGGVIVGPTGTVTLTSDTFYWRVYRRVVPVGEYELIASGAGKNLPPLVNWGDSAPPTTNGTKVCYYSQLLDENGNAGPITQLGCLLFKSGDLPIPLLSDPELLAAVGPDAQVELSFTCDPVGVDRFELWCSATGLDDAGVTGSKISPRLEDNSATVLPTEDGDLVFTPYQTFRPSGGNFGDGSSQFSLTLFVPAGPKLHFAVRAVGSGQYDLRPAGAFSNIVSKFWQEPDAPNQPVIPWPDRALPPLQALDFDIADCVKGEGPFYAQKLPQASGAAAGIVVGAFNPLTTADGSNTAFPDKSRPPLENFFSFRSAKGAGAVSADDLESIVPFVVYRHQVKNAANPDVVPNLVQVSPLIDRLTYKETPGFYQINDPFFIFPTTTLNPHNVRIPTFGIFKRDGGFNTAILNSQIILPNYLKDCHGLYVWTDRLPVVSGALYQYLLVHFDERGEVTRVIPTNTVQQ